MKNSLAFVTHAKYICLQYILRFENNTNKLMHIFYEDTFSTSRKDIPRTYVNSARSGSKSSEQGVQSEVLDPTTSLYVPTGHS